jgi:excinuclease ABC subunit B
MGRAARHEEGRVIMYADNLTKSIKAAIETTNKRREIQIGYNQKHNVKPQPIIKAITDVFRFDEDEKALPKKEFLKEYLHKLKNQLDLARRNLQFDKAATIADKIKEVKAKMEEASKE